MTSHSHAGLPLHTLDSNRPSGSNNIIKKPIAIAKPQKNWIPTSVLADIFGIDEGDIDMWPGTSAYCRYVELSFVAIMDPKFDAAWSKVGRSRPLKLAECWEWVATVAKAMPLQLTDGSISEVWQDLSARSAASTSTTSDSPAGNLILFATLLWTTMVFTPFIPSDLDASTAQLQARRQDGTVHTLKDDSFERPLPTTFRQLRRIMGAKRWQHLIGEDEKDELTPTSLFPSSLDYGSLSDICDVSIKWSDDLCSHLSLDPITRQLSIFRFPSFCAMSCNIKDDHTPLITKSLEMLYGVDMETSNETMVDRPQPHREILMSYRLLFGQSRRSRVLVKQELEALQKIRPDTFDPLLTTVCTRHLDHTLRGLPDYIWPRTCVDRKKGSLREFQEYNTSYDFPMFGQRLAKLQEFCLRQQPNKLRDFWRDRRHPLQWYTFWVVTIIGGVTVVLSILQLLVGIAQLIVAIQLPNDCRD
ncbi:hypothetical protein BDZ85DRAFT_12283 [Elsinoe ampelina]|uniref:Uncharacterized protein n=1 Tax=Elsinoe ampelina TaxID=302913 RepID=A0A6A6GQW4_9PEZI|nr:hypothetical protein BDZ85DRAFT_12283 [Elsinoe ampelina]